MTHTLTIPGWHPNRLNAWDGRHWAVRARLKKEDRAAIALAAAYPQAVPLAHGKRRVSLTLTLAPRQRAGDPDAYWKSLLDALTHAGLLLDDNRQGVELAPLEFTRGKEKATTIRLEDIGDGR